VLLIFDRNRRYRVAIEAATSGTEHTPFTSYIEVTGIMARMLPSVIRVMFGIATIKEKPLSAAPQETVHKCAESQMA
jgi:hypothetical protein